MCITVPTISINAVLNNRLEDDHASFILRYIKRDNSEVLAAVVKHCRESAYTPFNNFLRLISEYQGEDFIDLYHTLFYQEPYSNIYIDRLLGILAMDVEDLPMCLGLPEGHLRDLVTFRLTTGV